MTGQTRRALLVSHAHPDFSKGGSEVAAHGLFSGLNRCAGWDAYLLSRHGLPNLRRDDSPFSLHGGGQEILYDGGTDHFYFSNRAHPQAFAQFVDLLHALRPSVVHFHHYWNVGVEWLLAVKRYDPRVPVIVTLHEFLAICLQNGQMIKSNGQLCYRGSPVLCHSCLPQYDATALFLREQHLKTYFSHVDLFIAPSAFLKSRYVEWGLPAERIEVRENGQADGMEIPPATPSPEARPRTRFAYFGQLNPYKGIDVLLDAFAQLPGAIADQVRLEIHGGLNSGIPESFRQRLEAQLGDAHRNIRHLGPYAPRDLPRLLQGVDWVVVPSIWWENSPMVIQEAFLYGKPVICADIGGMAEKVRDGVDGLHFRARNAGDLARVVEHAATVPGLWERLTAGIRRPPTIDESAAQHVALYDLQIERLAAPLHA